MAAVIGALRAELSAAIGQFQQDMGRAADSVAGLAKRFNRSAKQMQSVGAKMSLVITAPLLLFGRHAQAAAVDAEELQSAFNFSFGTMADQMNAWAQMTGDALGRSTQAIQEMSFTFNQLFKAAVPIEQTAAQLSQQFTLLAQDLASFFNVSEDDALQKLRAGLVGEAEPLRAFGVFLNAAAVEAKAFELGLAEAGDTLTEQQKILARAAIIMEQTSDAQGDLARTAGSAANQQRAAGAAWAELSVIVGQKLIPVLTPLIGKVTEVLTAFTKLDPGTQTFIVGAGVAAAALGPLIGGLGSLVLGIGAVLPVLATLGRMLLTVLVAGTGPVGLAVAAVGAVVLAFADWDQILDIVGRVTRTAGVLIRGFVERLGLIGRVVARLLSGDFTGAWEAWKDSAGQGVRVVKEAIAEFQREVTPVAETAGVEIGSGLAQGVKTGADQSSAAMDKLLRDLADSLDKTTTTTTADQEKLARAIQDVRDEVQPVAAAMRTYTEKMELARQAGLDLAKAQQVFATEAFETLGGVDGLKVKLEELPPVLRRVAEAARRVELGKDQAEEMERAAEEIKRRGEGLTLRFDAGAARDKAIAEAHEALAAGAISAEVYDAAVAGAWKTFNDGAMESNENLQRIDLALDRMGQTLADVAFGSKDLASAFTDLNKQMVQILAIDPLLSEFKGLVKGGLGGGGGGGGVGNFFSNLFGGFAGFFAGGGVIPRGSFGIVGERGPELAFAGDSDLSVMPAGAPGMGRPIENNFYIQTPDADSFRRSQGQILLRTQTAMARATARNG